MRRNTLRTAAWSALLALGLLAGALAMAAAGAAAAWGAAAAGGAWRAGRTAAREDPGGRCRAFLEDFNNTPWGFYSTEGTLPMYGSPTMLPRERGESMAAAYVPTQRDVARAHHCREQLYGRHIELPAAAEPPAAPALP